MRRRTFLGTLAARSFAKQPARIDAEWYRRSRRFASLPVAEVAYVEHGRGPAALFLHGFPLNGLQWRGALERLRPYRRCIAPDLMSLGFTQARESQDITPDTQVSMLVSLLDRLRVDTVDLVANDSGGLVAQLFIARHPARVRTVLLTNCDVDENNPPAKFLPAVTLGKNGMFTERYVVPQLQEKGLARSAKGIGSAFTDPERLSDETLEMYFRPLIATPLRKAQLDRYTVSLGENVLVAIREDLRKWRGSARMVWGLKDAFFGVEWAEWLDRTLPGSHGVRRVENANLFFPEEMPDLIAEEGKALWGIG
jgi:haloalkane dehalogenase